MTSTENGTNGDAKSVVMVTGGSGLVGQAIKTYVEESGALKNEEWVFLSSKDGDLRVRKDTEAIFDKYKPTHVIHLAAKVGGLFANLKQKVRCITWNKVNFFRIERKSFNSRSLALADIRH